MNKLTQTRVVLIWRNKSNETNRSQEQDEARELTYRMAKKTPRSGRPPHAPAGSTSSLNRSPSQPSHRTVPSAPTGCTAVTPRAHFPVSICESAPPGAGHLTLTAAAPGHAAGRPSSLAGPTRTLRRRAPAGDFRATIPWRAWARRRKMIPSSSSPGLLLGGWSFLWFAPPTVAGKAGAGRRLLSLGGRVAMAGAVCASSPGSRSLARCCQAGTVNFNRPEAPRRHKAPLVARPGWPLIAAPHGRIQAYALVDPRGARVSDTRPAEPRRSDVDG
jgi:hypothetical protein